MPHDQCPPSRRGHAWQELPLVATESGPTIRDLVELRRCARCQALGRVDKQGRVCVVDATPHITRDPAP